MTELHIRHSDHAPNTPLAITDAELQHNWQLLAPHRQTVLAALERRYGLRAENEDLVHEALARCVSKPNLDPQRVEGLLITAATRLAVDMHRRQQREAAAHARSLTPAAAGAEEIAVDRAEARQLHPLLASLSAYERVAVLGRAHGLEPHETAELVGVTPRSMHLALSRARAVLKAAAEVVGGVAVIGVRVVQRPARRIPFTAGMAVVTATTLFALSQQASVMNGAPDPPATVSPLSLTAAPPPPHVTAARAGAAHAALATRPASRQRPGVARRGSQSQTVVKVAVPDPRLGHGTIVTVTRERDDQSLLQSVQSCVSPGGLSVTLPNVGCTDDGS